MRGNKKQRLAVALLTIMTLNSFSSFADGWKLDGNNWMYYDRDGSRITEEWKPNEAKTDKFYLGSDGVMLTNTLVEDGDNLYYVNEEGAMVKSEWRLLDTDDNEERWFYFTDTGKALEDGWKTIGTDKYHFTDHKMDYGWLDEEGRMIDEDEADAWEQATYYVGDNTQGQRCQDKWIEIKDFDTDKYDNRETLWVYMEGSGKKVVNKSKTINGKRYMFDEDGAMVVEWYGGATPSDASYKHYESEDGQLIKGKWFQAVPSIDQNQEDYENDTLRWFYANKNGVTTKGILNSISGKKYVFDENGIMQSGFVVVNGNKFIRNLGEWNGSDMDMPSASDLMSVTDGQIMYFAKDGVRKTGKFKMELDDDTYTLYFKKSGEAVDGIYNGSLYDHGILLKVADDDKDNKYEVVTWNGKQYLVNKQGKVQDAGTYRDSLSDTEYTVVGNNDTGYVITSINNK